MKIYVVKYALTEGIKELDAEVEHFCGNPRVIERLSPFKAGVYEDYEYTFTLDEARARAYAMRDKKIASLKKQIKKLETMEF